MREAASLSSDAAALRRVLVRGPNAARARQARGLERLLAADALIAALLGVGALSLYIKTAAPGVYSFDAAEFTIASATWGIPHASGYPLFVLLGRLFIAIVPVGDPAVRMALATALFAALTVCALYALLRELGLGRTPSLLAAAAFAVSYYQWASAVVTKEHSLHNLLLAAVLWLLLRWQRRGEFRWLAAASLAYGLSLANHLSAALYAPAILGFVLAGKRQGAARWLALAGAGALGLLPYLYLPLAYLGQPPFNIAGHYDSSGAFQPVNLASVEGLLWMLTARQFGGAMFGSPLQALPGQMWELAQWWWGNFFGVGVVLGLVGLKAFHDRNRAFFWMAAAVAIPHAAFFVSYAVSDRYNMFVPVYLMWTAPLAFGIERLEGILGSAAAVRAAQACLAAGVIAGAAANYPLVDLSGDRRPGEWARDLLERVPPNATVMARWAFSGPLRYEQLIEGFRPDVQVIDTFLISRADARRFVEENVDHKPLIVDDVTLFQPEELPGICGLELPGSRVDVTVSAGAGLGGAHLGYRLVRCR
jgi:hypothetical protein